MADRISTATLFGATVGRTAMALGLLLLAFAGYQLWGTGVAEARSQEELAAELALTLGRPWATGPAEVDWTLDEPGLGAAEPPDAALVVDQGAPAPAVPVGGTPNGRTAAAAPPPRPLAPLQVGEPFATLRIPTIGVDKTVVEGTTREALRQGPGHYLGTARPGQAGNVAIAGHRTTYGAPFRDIDQLEPGDPIMIETADGTFTYRVEAQTDRDGTASGHQIVAPEAVHVIADQGDHRLTLTACHPLYSASQRIVVTAVLDEPPPDVVVEAAVIDQVARVVAVAAPAAPAAASPSGARAASRPMGADLENAPGEDLVDDLGWQRAHAGATALWASLTALVVAAAWAVGRLWRRVPAYLMAVPSFTLCLLTCFGHLDRLIPAA